MSVSSLQDTHGERRKETVKAPNKKSPAAKLSPKPPKEKVVKPKKEVIKPGKPAKPDPTAKAKGAGHQPGVVRGITYYKAAKPAEDEHRGGERVGLCLLSGCLHRAPRELKQTLCSDYIPICERSTVGGWCKLDLTPQDTLLDQDQPPPVKLFIVWI